MKNRYVMWSDGVFTLLGKNVTNGTRTDGVICVKDPVTIVPTTEQELIGRKPDGTDEYRSIMRFEITPLVFRAALKKQDNNIWDIKANYILHENEFAEGLIEQYEHIVKVTERPAGATEVKKAADNDLIG